MKRKVFKRRHENKLYKLYLALDSYFNRPFSMPGYDRHKCTAPIGSIVPLLFQAASAFWCTDYKSYTKDEEYE